MVSDIPKQSQLLAVRTHLVPECQQLSPRGSPHPHQLAGELLTVALDALVKGLTMCPPHRPADVPLAPNCRSLPRTRAVCALFEVSARIPVRATPPAVALPRRGRNCVMPSRRSCG